MNVNPGSRRFLNALFVFAGLALLYVAEDYVNPELSQAPPNNSRLEQAITNRHSNTQVEGVGIVIKLLDDDLKGSRHQRFLVRLDSGNVILIAHNIDLAPRVDALRKGDEISFYGEYEWNDKGGVVHWTHHDPGQHHADGWLNYQGRVYQ